MNNNKNSLLLVDPAFDPQTAADCNLLLKITVNSLSYAIIDTNSKELKVVFDMPQCDDVRCCFKAALKKDVYLDLPFKAIKVSIYTQNTIAIPDTLYSEQNLNNYARFFSTEQSNNIHIQPFAVFGFTSIFNLENFTEDLLDQHLHEARKYEQNAPMLALASSCAVKEEKVLLLDFNVSSFNALLIDNGKMVFQNTFEVDNADEFNYYLVLIIQQLVLDKSTTMVLMSGLIHEQDSCYQCICSYFDQVSFNLPPSTTMEKSILEDMPAHYYSSLLALDLCV